MLLTECATLLQSYLFAALRLIDWLTGLVINMSSTNECLLGSDCSEPQYHYHCDQFHKHSKPFYLSSSSRMKQRSSQK